MATIRQEEQYHANGVNMASWLAARANDYSAQIGDGGILLKDAKWIGCVCADLARGYTTLNRVKAQARGRWPLKRGVRT